MKLALAYDTETTGLPLFSEPSEDPRQPHIVQLAAALVNLDTRETISSLDIIIRPDDWTIPDEVSKVHGITTEMAMDLGVPEEDALRMFMDLWKGRTRIAHNESFDARILRIAQHRFGYSEEELDEWKQGDVQCTAKMSTPVVKCPPTAKMRAAGRHHYKTPNLSEAYKHFTGEELQNAHSAMADVQGCLAVYWALQDLVKKELST